MDKQKIYIGIYKDDNHESLFYQKDINMYYDLKKRKKVDFNQIDLNSLIPYSDIIDCESNMKHKIIKLYDLDRVEKVNLSRVFLGDSYQVVRITSREYYSSSVVHTDFVARLLKEDILLLADHKILEYADFKEIENGEKYESLFFPVGGNIYIERDTLRPASYILGIDNKSIEKGKLLEKYREYKRR